MQNPQPNATQRFSNRVADYIAYRPGYPQEAIDYVLTQTALAPNALIADVGSGTGKLAEPFLELGFQVAGIEPNNDMCHAGDTLLARFPNFKSYPGSAESTGLASHTVDLAMAGQAFHWFDPLKTRDEFLRILKPGAHVALIWNERKVHTTPFLIAYEALLHKHCPEYPKVDHRNLDATRIAQFMHTPAIYRATFPNTQRFTYPALLGRLRSSSYVPLTGPANTLIEQEVEQIFHQHQQNNIVHFDYDTEVYLGQL